MAKVFIVSGEHVEEVTAMHLAGQIVKELRAMGHDARHVPIQKPLPNRPTITGWTGLHPLMTGHRDFRDDARSEKRFELAKANPDCFVVMFHNSPVTRDMAMTRKGLNAHLRLADRNHADRHDAVSLFDPATKTSFFHYPNGLQNLLLVEIPAVYKRNPHEQIGIADLELSRQARLLGKHMVKGIASKISRIISGERVRVTLPRRGQAPRTRTKKRFKLQHIR